MSSYPRNDQIPVKDVPSNVRISQLANNFNEDYGCTPTFYVRVPGRVNIIGEHIDYCGYPVLPMALEQDILLAVGVITEPKIIIRNVNNKYDSYDREIISYKDMNIEPDASGKPFWYNYVLCGVKGALEHLNDEFIHGLRLYVDGNIPPASGLSSSSALVSAACLAFLYGQNSNLSKTEIASLCAKSERYIGTQGGGMDQAIAFLAEKYCAQYITWQPLTATPVALPEDAAFVVAHSLAEANKAATNDFNRRVMECRLAAKILDVKASSSADKKIITLSQIQNKLGKNLQEMVDLVNEHLPKDIYSKEEISELLKVSQEEMDELFLSPNTRHLTEFKLKQRALHVYEEAMRVEDFRKFCTHSTIENNHKNGGNGFKNGENGDSSTKDTLDVLGQLMSGSHDSLRKLYECSHVNLDSLVDISKEMGIHSRLTGAGWGGCIVALCPKIKVNEYIETLVDKFYVKYCNIDKEEAKKYVFATTPNYGAVIYVEKS